MSCGKSLVACLVFLSSSTLRAQPNSDHFRILAVTNRAMVYVDTVLVVADSSGVVHGILRFEHDSSARISMPDIGTVSAGDLHVDVDCRRGALKVIGSRQYGESGKSVWIPGRLPVRPDEVFAWSAMGNDGLRIYGRVCALFAPKYAHEPLPVRERKRGSP